MSPAVVAVLGDALVAGYVPILRRQVREGVLDVPAGGVIPITVRREEHPVAFMLCIGGIIALLALIVLGSIGLLLKAYA
ncbi:MAG: hypothetical protein ACK4ZY_13775 [Sphingomonas sp.]